MDNRLDTKYVGHHISSGGFIFWKDKKTGDTSTLLITNKKQELWISKGHLEENENHIDTALREFEEEMGLKRKLVTYIDFLKKVNYSFDEYGGKNTKEVYVHIFSVEEKHNLSKNTGVEDITKIEWYPIKDALAKISFNKTELIEAQKVFEKSIKGNKDL